MSYVETRDDPSATTPGNIKIFQIPIVKNCCNCKHSTYKGSINSKDLGFCIKKNSDIRTDNSASNCSQFRAID